MHANRYDGMVPPEISRLILSRARRHRVSPDDIDDLQQQIVPLLAEFRFDPARANGATPTTAMTSVIDRQIKAHLRATRRYQRRVSCAQLEFDDTARDGAAPNPVVEPEPIDMRVDVEQTISRLSPRDQQVCQGIANGQTVTAIAEQLGCGRDTVDRAIARIRKVFEKAGLRAWIDPDYSSKKQGKEGRKQQ